MIGPTLVDDSDLGIVAGDSWVRFAQMDDLDSFEANQPVMADPDGDLAVLDRARVNRVARRLVETYVLGDARQSAAAAAKLEEIAHAL